MIQEIQPTEAPEILAEIEHENWDAAERRNRRFADAGEWDEN